MATMLEHLMATIQPIFDRTPAFKNYYQLDSRAAVALKQNRIEDLDVERALAKYEVDPNYLVCPRIDKAP